MRADLLGRLRAQHGGALVTTATRLIDVPCRYGMHLLIALRLPLGEVGAFYVVFGTMSLAAGLGRLGIDRALTREMARVLAHGEGATARAAMRRALWQIGLASLAVTAAAAALAWPAAAWVMHRPEMTPLFLIGAMTILPTNLAQAMAGALAGLHRVTASQIVYTWLWPGLFCAIAFLLPLNAERAMAAVVAAMVAALAIAALLLCRHRPRAEPGGGSPAAAPLLATGLSLFSAELVQLLISAAPPFVLGALSTTDAVGLYAIAWRIVLVIYMATSGVASMASPRFARLHMLGDDAALEREAGRAIGLALVLALAPIAAVTFAPERILLLFGHQFAPATAPLRILLVGQLAATLSTTTPELLGMTGYARSLLRINVAALAMLLAGLALLTPALGAKGAAIATAATMAFNAIGASRTCRRQLGFVPLGALYAAIAARHVHQAAASRSPA